MVMISDNLSTYLVMSIMCWMSWHCFWARPTCWGTRVIHQLLRFIEEMKMMNERMMSSGLSAGYGAPVRMTPWWRPPSSR